MLVGVVLMVGALTFVPALALGPIVEHLQMLLGGGCIDHEASPLDAPIAGADARCLRPRPIVVRARSRDSFAQARPARAGPQSGDVRRVRRQHLHDLIGIGALLGTCAGRRTPGVHARGRGLAVAHGAVRELRRGRGRGARQGAGRDAARRCAGTCRRRSCSTKLVATQYEMVEASALRRGDLVLVEAERHHPGRRRGRRRRRVGQRERRHRRVGAGAARSRRRLLVGDRRHARAVGLARRARHEPARAKASSTA